MKKRTWLITGVSSGFGYEMSRQLLERGDRVVGTVRGRDRVAALIEKYPDTFDCGLLDVTDVPAIHRFVDDAFRKHGRIDVIVSNAGYGLFGAAEELSDAEIDHIIATNLTGSIQLIRSALPHLRAQGGGRVIRTSWRAGRLCRQFSLPRHEVRHRGLLRIGRAGGRALQHRRDARGTRRSPHRVPLWKREGGEDDGGI